MVSGISYVIFKTFANFSCQTKKRGLGAVDNDIPSILVHRAHDHLISPGGIWLQDLQVVVRMPIDYTTKAGAADSLPKNSAVSKALTKTFLSQDNHLKSLFASNSIKASGSSSNLFILHRHVYV